MLEQRKQRHPSWLAYDPIPDLGGQDEERWLNGFAGLPLHCFNCCAYEGDGFIAPTRLNGDDAGRSGEELSELFMLVIPSGEEQLGRQRGVGLGLEAGPPPFERFCVAGPASKTLGDPVVHRWRGLEPSLQVVGVEHLDV